jgi:opacity protein-like surface antigen
LLARLTSRTGHRKFLRFAVPAIVGISTGGVRPASFSRGKLMRIITMVVAASLVASVASAQDADRSVKDGGIKVDGWKGRVDRRPASQGKTVADSRLAMENGAFRLSVGPAGNFWNPAHVAKGDYEVKGTFREHKMTATHPHSYGVFIGGADLESQNETLLYCIVYGDGNYAVKTFHGEKVTTIVDRTAHPALKKAGANGEATNEVGWRVKDGKASCVVNGTVVKSFDRGEVIAADRLKSLDGVYGLRVSHNVELTVSNFGVVR